MSSEQMESVCEMLVRIISVPVLSDALPFLFTGCGDDANLTNLQKIILSNIISLQKLAVYKTINNVYPQIFGLLSAMLTLCYEIPSFDAMNARLEAEGKRNRWLFANPEKLGNHLMKNASDLYQKVACDRSVIKNSILAKLIKTLLPFWDMKAKSSLWTVAHKVFISILSIGLPVVRQFAASITDEDALWRTVVHSFRSFLIENVWENEHAALHLELSCKTALLIKSEILVYRASYSKEFIDNVTLVLEKGQQQQGRDDFSKLCFEMASGISNESKADENSYEDIIKLVENIRLGKAEENQQLAVISRCTSLIRKIREESDEHVLTELAFLFQACRAILQNIVKDQRGSSQMTMKLYEFYPVLCNLIQKCPQQLLEPLSHALLAYQPFLSSE